MKVSKKVQELKLSRKFLRVFQNPHLI